jgi:hypothetical protein
LTSLALLILGTIGMAVGLLLLVGKVKLVIVYPEEEQPVPWPEPEEQVDNYSKPLEQPKPPTLVEAPKRRRGRPRNNPIKML